MDPYLFLMFAVISLVTLIICQHLKQKLPAVSLYQYYTGKQEPTARRALNIWGIAASVVFIGWFVGWYLTGGEPLGWIGAAMTLAFAVVSLATIRAVRQEVRDYRLAVRIKNYGMRTAGNRISG